MQVSESRRRTRRPGSNDLLTEAERAAVGSVMSDTHAKRRPPKRKLQRWERYELSDLSQLLVCLGIGIVVYTVRYRASDAADHALLQYTTKEFRASFEASRSLIAPHKKLYNQVYNLATQPLKPRDAIAWPEYQRRPYELKSSYGSSVQQCSLTVVVLDQNLGKPVSEFGPGQSLWFELESIASAIPADACVVLQTSKCVVCTLYMVDDVRTARAHGSRVSHRSVSLPFPHTSNLFHERVSWRWKYGRKCYNRDH
jgi:hypothetical protein